MLALIQFVDLDHLLSLWPVLCVGVVLVLSCYLDVKSSVWFLGVVPRGGSRMRLVIGV